MIVLKGVSNMDKKLFAELMEGAKQMEAHAAGKKVKGIR